ncbi:MAG: hypothetical protein ACD_51C00231G0006 [uncultured bacterium]|nr:MAG: hypothetical protein ACD_51C00231G0006 [uncultured bacterium]OGJ48595.1 MAG: ribosome recycling factor [Candidatus Peregrinibacteria bacterium RIFOXYB12_FULL_41_12]OGJ48686.1 MAG: ribosome recycling factor [Candidatus Peregrinibacteria bacterium RIFOXYA2_FULL_41_18]OGJ53473.1 MAG: ribosome recycling factor [Candidatus Peregrinibacteria bacterium RIFOXYB2_FULL_41_88]
MITAQYITSAKAEFEKAMTHLKDEYGKLQVGRAHPGLVEGLLVDAYGISQPLKAVASVTIPDAKTIQITPWDRSVISSVEKAIRESNLGLNPVNNGAGVILNIPPLTEERRVELSKVVKKLAEEAKIAIRNSRQTAHSKFKELEGAKQITEDEKFGAEADLQKVVDEYNKKIDEQEKVKVEQIMKI